MSTPAYSPSTKTHYDSWDELVKAESNGWAVVAILSSASEKNPWPWMCGTYESQKDANNARVRLRNKFKREKNRGDVDPSTQASFYVRPLWKDVKNR